MLSFIHHCYFNWTLIIKFILIVFIQLVYDNELLLHCILTIDVLLNCLIYFLSQCRCKYSPKFSVRNFDWFLMTLHDGIVCR